jgi:small nuclear ribonucleoprotein (snRNP)-like protein
MRRHTVWSAVLAVVLAANQTLMAQHPPADDERWRTFAQSLNAGARVEVRLRDGTTVRGTLVSAQETAMQVLPDTRLQIPVRSLAYRDVDVIDRWRKGWSPGTKTVVTIGAGFGVVLAVTAAVLAASYE